eukprot:5251850-Pleurochrysis_carterae.AAC.2
MPLFAAVRLQNDIARDEMGGYMGERARELVSIAASLANLDHVSVLNPTPTVHRLQFASLDNQVLRSKTFVVIAVRHKSFENKSMSYFQPPAKTSSSSQHATCWNHKKMDTALKQENERPFIVASCQQHRVS